MSVDESTVIFGPIRQVGWASASSTVTAGELARGAAPERAPAGREHQPGHLVGAVPGPQALVQGAVLGVHGHDLGTRGRLGPGTTGAPAMRDSLLARASRRPASRAARVTGSPAKPTTALTTTSPRRAMAARPSAPVSTSVPGGTAAASAGARAGVADGDHLGPQRRAWAASTSTERQVARPTARNRSGSAVITSTAWVPMDPVDPTRLTLTGRLRRRRPGSSARSPAPPPPHPRWSTRTR